MKKKLLLFALLAAVAFSFTSAKAFIWPTINEVMQTGADKTSITVAWSAQDCVSYNVYYREYSSMEYALFGNVTTTTCTITGLKSGEKYDVKIEGVSADGNTSSKYLDDAVTIVDKINNLTQETWYHFIESASVKWDDMHAVDSYEYVFKNGKGKKVKSGTASYSGATFSVKNNQIYTFQVRASQTYNGQKYYTPWSTIKVYEQPWITKGKLANKKLTFSWAKQAGATGYEIYVSTNNKDYKKVKTVGKSKNSYTLKKFKGKSLKKKKYYVYIVSKTKLNGVTCKSGRVYSFTITSSGSNYGYINR